MLIKLTAALLRPLKREIAPLYPEAKSALLSEALARGLGFESANVMAARLAEGPRVAPADDGALLAHLGAAGIPVPPIPSCPVFFRGGADILHARNRPLLQAATRRCGMAGAIPESAAEHALLSVLGMDEAMLAEAARRIARACTMRRPSAPTAEPGIRILLSEMDAGRLSAFCDEIPRHGAGTPAFAHLEPGTPWNWRMDPPPRITWSGPDDASSTMLWPTEADWRLSLPSRIAWCGPDGGSSTLVWPTVAIRIEFDREGSWEARTARTSTAASARALQAWRVPGAPARARAEAAWSAISEVPEARRIRRADLPDGPGAAEEFEALVMDGLRAAAPAGRPALLLERCAALLAIGLRIAEWKLGRRFRLTYEGISDACSLDAMHAAAHDPRVPDRVREGARTFLLCIPGYRLDAVPSRQHPITLSQHRTVLRDVLLVLEALRFTDGTYPILGREAPDWAALGLVPGAWDDSPAPPAAAPIPSAAPARTLLTVLCGWDGGPGMGDALLWKASESAARSPMPGAGIYAVCGPESLATFRGAPQGEAGLNTAVPSAGADAAIDDIRRAEKHGAACIVLQGPLGSLPLLRLVMSASAGNSLVAAVPESAGDARAAFLAACDHDFLLRVWRDLEAAGAVRFEDMRP